MTKQHLLLVDGDPGALRLMEASLVKAGFAVTTAAGGQDALAKCRAVRPDLVLSETEMPGMDGFELCRRLKADARLADVPFVFLSARHRSVEDKVRGLELGDDYLTRPFAVREVVMRVRNLLEKKEKAGVERHVRRASLAGALSDMSVVDLIQTLEIGSKTGTVNVDDVQGRSGTIWMREGRVVDCVAGQLSGEPAFYRLLRWREGRFAIEFKPVDCEERIRLPTQLLLIDGVRRMDEWSRALEELPPLDAVLQIDYRLLSERLAEIPDDVNTILKLIDGRRKLAEVVEDSRVDDLSTASAVAMLIRDRILTIRAVPPAEAPAAAGALAVDAEADQDPARDPSAELGGSVDWLAGPVPAEPKPDPRPAEDAVQPGPGEAAAPRIVRFATKPRKPVPGESAEPPPPTPSAPARRPSAYAFAIAVALALLAFGAWATLARNTARQPPRATQAAAPAEMRGSLEPDK